MNISKQNHVEAKYVKINFNFATTTKIIAACSNIMIMFNEFANYVDVLIIIIMS